MRTLGLIDKALVATAISAVLAGCPLAAQKDSVLPSEEKPDEAIVEQESIPASSDRSSLYEFFRRRVFIDGREVTFSGGRSTFKGRLAPDKHHHHALGSRLRMMLTDPRFDETLGDLGEGGDLLRQIIHRLFGDFTVSRVLVNVISVEVHPEGGAWETIVDFGTTGHIVDLMAMSRGALLEMGTFSLPPGKYVKVRLNLAENNKVEVDEGRGLVMRPLRTPSRAHERIELTRPFEVSESGLTTLVIDFDVNQSIRKFFGSYWIQPKLKILSASTTSAMTKLINASEGGVIGVFGEIVVSIPPGALAEDTEVSLTPIYRLSAHESENLYLIGHEYLLGPVETPLLKPMRVAISYDGRYASALGIDPETYDLFQYDEGMKRWSSTLGNVERGTNDVTTTVQSFGRIAVGGVPLDDSQPSGPGCAGYGDAVMFQPTKTGLDLQYFSAACNRHALCYAHGFKTYRLEGSACQDSLKTDMMARCDDLCKGESSFGKACSTLTAEDMASAKDDGFTSALYEACVVQASNAHGAVVSGAANPYPGNQASTCKDYEGRGVSCSVPVCALTVDRSSVKKGVPSDLTFTLQVTGSVDSITFDGTVAYQQEGLSLPIDRTIIISEVGRILDEPRAFSANIASPSGAPVSCGVTVAVEKDPDPCTMAFTPRSVNFGDATGMFLKVAPGFTTAQFDLRSEGAFLNLPLGNPLPDGSREVTMAIRPQTSRVYTAKVKNAAGEEFSCSDSVSVVR